MGMYGISERLSGMFMASFIVNTMNMNMAPMSGMQSMNMKDMSNAGNSSQGLSGLGDIFISLNYSLIESNSHNLILTAGESIPTGQTGVINTSSFYNSQAYSYLMQTGSGTFGTIGKLSYIYTNGKIAIGNQIGVLLRTGMNAYSYRLGNEYSLTSWISYRPYKMFGISMRLSAMSVDKMHGYDPGLYSVLEPAADSRNYGSIQVLCLPGLNFYPGFISGASIGLEYAFPLYQYLNGIQMPLQSQLMAKAQFTF